MRGTTTMEGKVFFGYEIFGLGCSQEALLVDLEFEGKGLADRIQTVPEGLFFGRIHRTTVSGNSSGHNGKTLNPLTEFVDG